MIAGPLVGAALLLLGSAAATFAVNGASFLVGAMVVAALPREATRRPASAEPESHASLRGDLAAGWRALREHPDTLPLVGADFVSSTIYGALTVLFVLLGQKLGLGAAGYGYLLSALGVGGVLAASLAHRAAASERPRRALIAAVAAVGVPLVAARSDRVDCRRARPRRRASAPDADDRGRRGHDASALGRCRGRSPAPTGSSCRPASPGSPAARSWRRCCVALFGLDATLRPQRRRGAGLRRDRRRPAGAGPAARERLIAIAARMQLSAGAANLRDRPSFTGVRATAILATG